jgi:SPP1 gp7 family putative phage head morphogenesis protein
MNSKKYWQERALNRSIKAEKIGVDIMNDVLPVYDRTLRFINKDINRLYVNYANKVGLDVVELTRILSGADRNNFLKSIKGNMRKLGLNVEDVYNKDYLMRLNRLEALKQQIYWEIQAISPSVQNIEKNGFTKMIKDSYEVASKDVREQMYGTLGRSTFSTANTDMIQDILRSTWVGGNYSTRTFRNIDGFAIDVRNVLGSGLVAGVSQDKMVRSIRERFDVAKYDVMRVIRTETTYFQNQAELRSYEDEGVEYYEYVAVMDGRTSDICEGLDGKIFKVSEAEVGKNYPPMHPQCRSTTLVASK